MKKTLAAISHPAILFALTLSIGSLCSANAVAQDDIGSFDDILVALEAETALEGAAINGPLVVDSPPATPVQSGGLILEGPLTTPRSTHYPPANQTAPGSVIAPGQIENPFLDFEPEIEASVPKHAAETQFDYPPAEVAPTIVAPRETLPRIAAPVPREFAIPQPTVQVQPRVVTKTIVVETQCPLERAQQLERLRLQAELSRYGGSRSYQSYKTGYIPYGGRGLERDYRNYRDYDRYRSAYPSRSTRYVPVPYSQNYRYSRSSSYYGGRGIGFGF